MMRTVPLKPINGVDLSGLGRLVTPDCVSMSSITQMSFIYSFHVIIVAYICKGRIQYTFSFLSISGNRKVVDAGGMDVVNLLMIFLINEVCVREW